jgi:type VI secretion system protein ImpK
MPASFVDTITGQTLNLDLSKALRQERRTLEYLCTDLYLIAIRMREAEDLGEPGALYKLIKYYIGLFQKNCKVMGLADESISAATYAVVALLDETVLSIPGKCRDYWIANPLQLEYFGDNLAGEGFYRKLEKLLVDPSAMREILNVYYLCLALGFEGKYRISNAVEREKIVENLGRQLRRGDGGSAPTLSPHGHRRRQGASSFRKPHAAPPLWRIAAVAAAVLCVSWIVLLVISFAKVSAVLTQLP